MGTFGFSHDTLKRMPRDHTEDKSMFHLMAMWRQATSHSEIAGYAQGPFTREYLGYDECGFHRYILINTKVKCIHIHAIRK